MDASNYAAWYAAVVATAILIWDVFKWKKTGAQIKAEARAGWRSYGIAETEGQDLTFVNVANVGDRPTTITSMGMYWYPPGVSFRDKTKRKGFVIAGGLAGLGQIPTKIEPGDVWKGLIEENDKFNQMLNSGRLVVALGFSHTDVEELVEIELSANNALQPTAENGG